MFSSLGSYSVVVVCCETRQRHRRCISLGCVLFHYVRSFRLPLISLAPRHYSRMDLCCLHPFLSRLHEHHKNNNSRRYRLFGRQSVSLQASRAEKTEMIEEVAAVILLLCCLETDRLLEEDDYHQTVRLSSATTTIHSRTR